MEGERQETYERIPWDTLRAPRGDRQWIFYLVAGAIVVGALAYSFMSNRPVGSVTPAEPVAATPATVLAAPPPPAASPIPEASPVAPDNPNPVVVSEADLYAVDPDVRRDQAAAHAEWFAAEYFTVDGSALEGSSLATLMPLGIPLPEIDDGTRVFVESARAVASESVDGLNYRVDVLVRWLKSSGDDVYVRQTPVIASVEVQVGEAGPSVLMPPVISPIEAAQQSSPPFVEVPEEIASRAMKGSEATEVVGGVVSADGTWRVVVMAPGPDGLIRPQTISVP